MRAKTYVTLLISITVGIVLTLLISSSIYYVAYADADLKRSFASDVNDLSQTSKEIVTMNESAQSLSYQIYRNYAIAKLLFYDVPNVYDVQIAMGELNNYLNSMPYIESIYVYNPKQGTFYIASNNGQNGLFTARELTDRSLLDVIDHFKDYKPFNPIPRLKTLAAGAAGPRGVYTYLCYDAIGREETINSAVVINFSPTWLNKGIVKTPEQGGGSTYILDDEGQLLISDSLLPAQVGEKDMRLLDTRIRQRSAGYLVADFNRGKSLISYTSPDELGWQYVRVTSYKVVTQRVSALRNNTLIAAAVILACGLLIAWMLSRMLYVPIRRIEDRIDSMETEQRNNLYSVKMTYLRQLLLGTHMPGAKAAPDKLARAGIGFDFSAPYRLVLFKIDRFDSLREERGSDLSVYRFAMMNISSEIGAQAYRVEAADVGDDRTLLLLGLPTADNGGEGESVLIKVLQQVQEACQQYLHIGLSVTYSPVASGLEQLAALYRQTEEASLHRLFYGCGCCIDAERAGSRPLREYTFPVEAERRMLDAFRSGRTEEAKKLLSDILDDTCGYPIDVARSAISHVGMTVSAMLYEMEKHAAFDFGGGSGLQLPLLQKLETMGEVKEALFSLFEEMQDRLVGRRSAKQTDLTRAINELIEKRYADPDLDVNRIALELGLSPTYMSRIYRQHSLSGIVDVINDTRMNKAREMLERTDSPVAEIAEKIGYSNNSYFHRVFKKKFGVTPKDYRDARARQTESAGLQSM